MQFTYFRLYAVVVVPNDQTEENYDDVGPYVSPNQPYVAAAWDDVQRIPESILVGDGSDFIAGGVTYRNVPLNSNTRYTVLARIEIVSDDPTMVNASVNQVLCSFYNV